jgi:hypothetical protein
MTVEKPPVSEGAGTGGIERQFKSSSGNYITADDAIAILHQAQAVVAGMAATIDRMSASIARAVSP